jgi:hypothetical protein
LSQKTTTVNGMTSAVDLTRRGEQALLGIDFSGDARMWSPGCGKSNVWIAEGSSIGSVISVERLFRVQDLEAGKHPFDRLSAFISARKAITAIDAPFAIPATWFEGDVRKLWKRIAALEMDGRPFPKGERLIKLVSRVLDPRGKHVWRETEQAWRERRVNVRSTVWCGHRGGAPFAVAMMTLLARHRGGVWPFTDRRASGGILVEAFPAAQLCEWRLPFQGYGGSTHTDEAVRMRILAALFERGLRLRPDDQQKCVESADPLDAAICLFAAKAVSDDHLAIRPTQISTREGCIAVHK